MPLAKDPKRGGTEADGSRTIEYCSHCYEMGEFTQPNVTADEMVVFVQQKLRNMRVPGFLARRLTQGIPKLRRWN